MIATVFLSKLQNRKLEFYRSLQDENLNFIEVYENAPSFRQDIIMSITMLIIFRVTVKNTNKWEQSVSGFWGLETFRELIVTHSVTISSRKCNYH